MTKLITLFFIQEQFCKNTSLIFAQNLITISEQHRSQQQKIILRTTSKESIPDQKSN